MRCVLFGIFASVALMAQVSGKPDCAVDGSTVNAITGAPVARVKVSVVAGKGSVSQVTDNSGKWAFSGVPCKALQVFAERPGFLPGRYMGDPAQDLTIRLVPSAVIAGRVLDDQGEPVIKTQVYTLDSFVIDGRRTFVPGASTTTNDLGEYRLTGLVAGKDIVCARASGALPALSWTHTTYGDKCYPGPIEQASTVRIAAGSDTKVDFTLEQVPAVHIRGTVFGLPEGVGVGVTLVRSGAMQNFQADRSAYARPDSAFDIADVAPGSYILKASLARGASRLAAHLPIYVGPSGADGVALRLEPAATFKGSVRIETQAGGVAPSERHVQLLLRSTEQPAGARIAESNDNLTFAIGDVPPGDYKLSVFSVPSPFYVTSATMAGQDVLGREFSFSEATGPVEIVLRDDGGDIEGDIVNTDGQPVSGGVLALRNGRAITYRSKSHFELQDLAQGDYQVYAWDDPTQVEYADSEWMRRYAGSGVAVTVTAGQTSQVKLTLQTVPQ